MTNNIFIGELNWGNVARPLYALVRNVIGNYSLSVTLRGKINRKVRKKKALCFSLSYFKTKTHLHIHNTKCIRYS